MTDYIGEDDEFEPLPWIYLCNYDNCCQEAKYRGYAIGIGYRSHLCEKHMNELNDRRVGK